jgi:hypothetical protein
MDLEKRARRHGLIEVGECAGAGAGHAAHTRRNVAVTRVARYAYPALAWLFVVGLLVQVFFAGLGIFAGPEKFATHVDLGWTLHPFPVLIALAAGLSRAGRRHWLPAFALFGLVFLIPFPVFLRDSAPAAAALHPVLAVASFWLATVVARRSLELWSRPRLSVDATAGA